MSVELLPCRECGAPCSVQVFDSPTVEATIWICSQHKTLGGECPSTTAYLYAEAWNTRIAAHPGTRHLREALSKCRDQFDFYAREHRSAQKFAKAETNQQFADMCSEALSQSPSPMEDEVERVARAISDANWKPTCTREFLDKQFNDPILRPLYLKQARAAIAAIRGEP
jgi:hypothetical protein